MTAQSRNRSYFTPQELADLDLLLFEFGGKVVYVQSGDYEQGEADEAAGL